MERLFGAIPSVLKTLGPNGFVTEAVVFAAWSQCVGKPVRLRTSPLEFFENRLVIAVQDATWRRHLEELSPQIIYKLNASLEAGTISFIEFRVDKQAANTMAESECSSETGFNAEMITPALRNAAEAIADENLRTQFLSAAAGYLAKQEKKVKGENA